MKEQGRNGYRARLFFRPFGTVRRADQAMMDAWYDMVGGDDTIICLGDVVRNDAGAVRRRHPRGRRPAARRHSAATIMILSSSALSVDSSFSPAG